MERVTDFSDLPEAFALRQPDGSFVQTKQPCFRLLADGFYGPRTEATHYEEGEIVIADMTPNYHMQPLNKAAAKRTMAWLESLPMAGTVLNIEDLTEATLMIAKNPKLAEMTAEEISAATHKLAVELKKRRDGTAGMYLPPMQGETIHTLNRPAGKPPAMMGARFLDPTIRGPGQTERGVISEPQRQKSDIARAAPMPGVSR
jgi:hypothetical protein